MGAFPQRTSLREALRRMPKPPIEVVKRRSLSWLNAPVADHAVGDWILDQNSNSKYNVFVPDKLRLPVSRQGRSVFDVGWVERSEPHHEFSAKRWGSLRSTHPTALSRFNYCLALGVACASRSSGKLRQFDILSAAKGLPAQRDPAIRMASCRIAAPSFATNSCVSKRFRAV